MADFIIDAAKKTINSCEENPEYFVVVVVENCSRRESRVLKCFREVCQVAVPARHIRELQRMVDSNTVRHAAGTMSGLYD